MKRRTFLSALLGTVGASSLPVHVFSQRGGPAVPTTESVKVALAQASAPAPKITKLELSDADWKKRLTAEQYRVLRDEGTERAGSSPLDREKRPGVFHCAGCDLPVFTSEMKFDSGTGWPSYFTALPGAFVKKIDFKLIYPRTEYQCARCGGHHGHIFKDGPAPTGERWCNNGVSLTFKPRV